ncbi:MAG: hypothetical protein SOY26_01785 [Paludibacteraceae bacterium]|nr:hypothetical protein [Paludibacteraceae bacterium]
MKKEFIMAVCAIMTICFTVTSCETEDPFEGKKCVATYTYNYYWKNTLSQDVSIKFVSYDSNRHLNRLIDKLVVLAPNSVAKVECYTQNAFVIIGSNEKAPVYTVDDGLKYLWYDAPTEGYQYEFGMQIGNDEYRKLDIEQNKRIFQIENYVPELIDDTTFNFYFTVDSAYLSMLW